MLASDKIVILSGPICSGKSALANALAKKFELLHFKSTDLVRENKRSGPIDREALQRHGRKLDKTRGSNWLCDEISKKLKGKRRGFILDSARTREQINAFRDTYQRKVIHVHLFASNDACKERWEAKPYKNEGRGVTCYEDTQRDAIERNINSLKESADITIDTERCDKSDVLERVSSLLGLYGRSYERLVDVLIGGQYGSEGKGNIAAYLAPEYDYLVRVGGPNAGHKVKTAAQKSYTFHQLPSGTAHSNAKLVIGPGAVINPEILLKEIKTNEIGIDRLFIDPNAMLISDEDRESEKKLVDDIASTGSGTGYAAARRIMYRGQPSRVKLVNEHPQLKKFAKPALDVFDDAFRHGKKIFLEGTQGTGLSLYHGHYPHVTSRDTTVSGCLAEAGISSSRVRRVIMVCRTYPIRVADSDAGRTSGPMSKEVTREELARRSGLPLEELEELTSTTLRPRRIGEFDWTLLRKSTSLNAPTDIALTFADYLTIKNQKARRFELLHPDTIHFIEEIERFTSAPVSLISTRFHHERSIIDRRSW